MRQNELPFEVALHDLMVMRVAGKDGTTVLTVERNLYNVKVCEYSEPLFYFRDWWYPTLQEALLALATYLSVPEQAELLGWIRSSVLGVGTRRAPAMSIRRGGDYAG